MNNEERNIKLCPFQMLKSGSSPPYCVEEYCAWWHIRCGTKKAGCCSLIRYNKLRKLKKGKRRTSLQPFGRIELPHKIHRKGDCKHVRENFTAKRGNHQERT